MPVSPTTPAVAAPTTLSPTYPIRYVATTLHGGLKQAGVMFDVRVPSVDNGGPPEGLTVISMEVSTFLTTDVCVEVYTKDGTYVGFENDVYENPDGTWSSPTWVEMGAATTKGKGDGNPVSVFLITRIEFRSLKNDLT